MSKEKTSARPLTELDLKSREKLAHITTLQPHEMNAGDRAFMRARRDYLTSDQLADYVENEDLPNDEAPAAEGDDDSYETWKLADLKAEAEARGLEVTPEGNKKAPWVAALVANDEAAG